MSIIHHPTYVKICPAYFSEDEAGHLANGQPFHRRDEHWVFTY